MATLASLGGNFTAAGSWALCDANAALDSEAATSALSTTAQDSSTFIPAAVAIDAVFVKIASRASGSPSNTITVTLRNSTTATNVASVTINVSDLDVCTTSDHAGGWYAFKLASIHTPNGTDSYLVRVVLSSTTTAVSLWTSATTNFARQLRTTTTQAPAAGDLLLIGGEFTGAGTGNNITITMDSTATTQYGVIRGVGDSRASISVGKRGTMNYGTAAATNYVLRMAGNFVVYSGGTATLSTVGTPTPRDSTAVMEFVPTASGDSGVLVFGASTFTAIGQSRTAGKAVVRTLLTADAAAAATTVSVADDTGWLSGDVIRFFPTKRTANQGEDRTLNANAGASSLVVTAGLTNAHDGTGFAAGEVILYTRNVKIRSTVPTAQRTFVFVSSTATVDLEWVEFQGIGSTTNTRTGMVWGTTTGSFTLKFSSFRDLIGDLKTDSVTNPTNYTIADNVGSRSGSPNSGATFTINATTSAAWSFTNNWFDAGAFGFSGDAIYLFNSIRGTITGNRAAGCPGDGVSVSETTNPSTPVGTFGSFVSHSNSGFGFRLAANWFGTTIDTLTGFRNGGGGLRLSAPTTTTFAAALTLKNVSLTGNAGQNFVFGNGHFVQTLFDTWTVTGESSFTSATGYSVLVANMVHEVEWRSAVFGATNGHTTADFDLSAAWLERHSMWNSRFASSTRINIPGSNTIVEGSYVAETKKDQTSGVHLRTIPNRGTIATDAATFHTAAPAEKLSPSLSTANTTAGLKLRSSSKRAAVTSGNTVTFSVWVRKDGSYTGAATRLVLRANPAAGISADVVLATAAAAANTWEQLTGTSAAVTDNAVLEAYVDVDGTAGAVYNDDWAVS